MKARFFQPMGLGLLLAVGTVCGPLACSHRGDAPAEAQAAKPAAPPVVATPPAASPAAKEPAAPEKTGEPKGMTDAQRTAVAGFYKQIEAGKAKEALQAIEAMQREVEGPEAAEIFYVRGLAQAALGDTKGADQSYMTAYSVVRYGRNEAARRLLGRVTGKLNLPDEARAAWDDVLKEVPGDPEATAALAKLKPVAKTKPKQKK